MATNGASASTEASLDKIKRHLNSNWGRTLLQGPLLKRSETLRKWNERWVILDPSTGKMVYKIRRNEPKVKGTIVFDASSTIVLSPVNFQGLPKYDGCCIYIGTPQKMDYFLCAETPAAARAWVSTLHATQLVLKAHKEAINSLSGNSSAQLGTVATVVVAANETALEASKELEAAMKISLRNALGSRSVRSSDGQMDDAAIMKETLRVKDEELQNLARELRARESAIKELAEKLSETAQAAEDAASAAHRMDDKRRIAYAEKEQLKEGYEKQLESTMAKLRESEEKVVALIEEIGKLTKQRDSAVQEAHLWRSELGKSRERNVILEAAIVRAEDMVKMIETNSEARIKEAVRRESAASQEKEELLSYVNALKMLLQRQQIDTKQVFEESCSDKEDTRLLTKHMDSYDENINKVCLSISRAVPDLDNDAAHISEAGSSNVRPRSDGQLNDIQTTESRIADVREVNPHLEGRSLDIPVVSSPSNEQQDQGGSFSQN